MLEFSALRVLRRFWGEHCQKRAGRLGPGALFGCEVFFVSSVIIFCLYVGGFFLGNPKDSLFLR